jgi:hypothetical protein
MNITQDETNSYFNMRQVDTDLLQIRQMLREGERLSHFVCSLFETECDGFIEWYEFLDLLIVLKTIERPLTRKGIEASMKEARKNGISRPWSFDQDGKCSMSEYLKMAKKAFRALDSNGDGVVDKSELYGFE